MYIKFLCNKMETLRDFLIPRIVRMFETGVYSKYSRFYARTGLNCLSNNIVLSVGMEYAAPLFLLLLCSYLLVLIIFAIEVICYRFANNKNDDKEEEEDEEEE